MSTGCDDPSRKSALMNRGAPIWVDFANTPRHFGEETARHRAENFDTGHRQHGGPELLHRTRAKSAPRHRNRNRQQFFESQTKSQGISAARSNLAIFHRKTHRNRNRIVTAKKITSWNLDELVGTTCNDSMQVALQSSPQKSLRTV